MKKLISKEMTAGKLSAALVDEFSADRTGLLDKEKLLA